MKKIFLFWGVVSILGLNASVQELKTKTEEFPAKEMKKQNAEIVRLSSEEISKTLPQKVDKYTTLTKVVGEDTTLIYTFEINTGSKSDETVQKEDKSRMQKAITTGVCQSASKFLEAEVKIRYVYLSSKSKAELFHFDIAQADCPARVE